MKTQKQSFEELRVRAQALPFVTSEQYRSESIMQPPYFDVCTRKDDGKDTILETVAENCDKETAEAIARLLNTFVAGDGLQVLRDAEFLTRQAGKYAGPMKDSFNRSSADFRALIAQLDGHANTD